MDIAIGAKDLDGTITQVEIFLNGTSIAIKDSRPYIFSYEFKNIQPGDYLLEVVATDVQGGQRSDVRVIRVLPDQEEFNDPRDGNIYRYVTIGNQTWMTDNLAFLPEVSLPIEESKSIPYYYVYDYFGNDVSTAKQTDEYSKFGVLYNWEAVKQASPEGWHLPTESEWQELLDYIENEVGIAGESLGLHLLHTSEGGTNRYGFSAVRVGGKISFEGYIWWSCSYEKIAYYGDDTQYPVYFSLWSDRFHNWTAHTGTNWNPESGLPVRCIKD